MADFENLISQLKGMGNKEVPKVKRAINNIIKGQAERKSGKAKILKKSKKKLKR